MYKLTIVKYKLKNADYIPRIPTYTLKILGWQNCEKLRIAEYTLRITIYKLNCEI